MIEDVTIPEIGENVESGTVVSVLVKEGDRVDVDDGLIELETDKAVVEIPSTAKGRIVELLAKEGDEKKVGDVIAKVDTEAEDTGAGGDDADTKGREPKPEAETTESKAEAPGKEETQEEADHPPQRAGKKVPSVPADDRESPAPTEKAEPEAESKEGRTADRRGPAPAAPSIRRLARELGVDIHDVPPTGADGRITEADVKSYVQRQLQRAGSAPAEATAESEMPDFSQWGDIETSDLSTVRRLTAASMARSWRNVPHVTQFDRAEITHLQAFIDRHAETVAGQGGKLTVTAVLVKVCAEALKRHPRFNASLDVARQRIIFKQYRHIGIAVATSRGLLVPVVRHADAKNITDIAVEITDLADRARNKKLKPDEMEGGTFTVSNQGGIGGTQFAPIVFWPQVAILGVSRAAMEPVRVKDTFESRPMLPLSLSYDHRIVDGADAAAFLRWVCDSLENPLTMAL